MMDLIIIDLTGPMSVPTWLGMSYALVVVEASCCLPIEQFLKAKSEAAAAIKEIVTTLEKQSGKRLKRIQSNLGMEFMKELIDNSVKKMASFTRLPCPTHQNKMP